MPTPTEDARARLRDGLREAMHARDRTAASALRAGLSAIDQAEAIPMDGHAPTIGGSGDVARRELTAAEVQAALAAEVAERRTALAELRTVGQDEAADRVVRELDVLLPHVPADPSAGPP